MAQVGFKDMSPKPRTLDEANAEVLRLRIALVVSNQKWSNLWAKSQLDKKASMGQLQQLQKRVLELGNLVKPHPIDCKCDKCKAAVLDQTHSPMGTVKS